MQKISIRSTTLVRVQLVVTAFPELYFTTLSLEKQRPLTVDQPFLEMNSHADPKSNSYHPT